MFGTIELPTSVTTEFSLIVIGAMVVNRARHSVRKSHYEIFVHVSSTVNLSKEETESRCLRIVAEHLSVNEEQSVKPGGLPWLPASHMAFQPHTIAYSHCMCSP